MTHQHQARVRVTLVAAPLPPRKRRRVAPVAAHQRPERIPVVAVRCRLGAIEEAPAVARSVRQVEQAGVLAVADALRLTGARRERAEVVGENIGGRRGAVGEVGIVAGGILLGQAQARPQKDFS